MSSRPVSHNPREWLLAKLEELNEVRNVGTRAPTFKAWRQGTLTTIQRTWPGDPSRSERFRRIPFSPPSSRADRSESREWYERGCAEAAVLLKQYLEEAPTTGTASVAPAAPSEPNTPGTFEDDFPTVELPGAPSKPAPPKASAPEAPPRGASRSTPHAASPGERAEKARPAGKAKGGKHKKAPGRLKDMLGLGRFEAKPEGATSATGSPARAIPPHESATPAAPASRADATPASAASPPRDRAVDPLLTSDVMRMIEFGMRGPDSGTDAVRPRTPEEMNASAAPPVPMILPLEVVDVRETHFDIADSAPRLGVEDATPLQDMDRERFDPRLVKPAAIEPLVSDFGFESGSVVRDEREEQAVPPAATTLPAATPPPAATTLPAATTTLAAMTLLASTMPLAAPPPPAAMTPPAAPLLPEVEPVEAEVASDSPAEPGEPEPEVRVETFEDADRATAEFLRTSPVLTSRAQPVRKRSAPEFEPGQEIVESTAAKDREEAPRAAALEPAAPVAGAPIALPAPTAHPSEEALTSPSALGVQALASSVARLGVPEGHRARARATLTDLARKLETGSVEWEELRGAVQFAMEFPALAVRLVPLLLPYFEDAA